MLVLLAVRCAISSSPPFDLMDYQRQTNGRMTFFEHWGLIIPGVAGMLIFLLISYLTGLAGASWIHCYGIALTTAAIGVGLIFYAKIPLYRQRSFFTFGTKALPRSRSFFYRAGYCGVLLAIGLLLCLSRSRP